MFKGNESLVVGDLIYFQQTANELGSKYSRWIIGQVDKLEASADGKARRVKIRYKLASTSDFLYIERSVRSLIRIFSLEDLSIHEVLEEVSQFVKTFMKQKQQEILTSNVSVFDDEEQRLLDAAACSLTEEDDVGLTMDWPSNTKNENFNYDEGFMQHCDCFADFIA